MNSTVNADENSGGDASLSPRPALASELIAHLESGGLIATGDPDHVMFLRYEIWESDGRIHKYLGAYGWASALGTVEGKLRRVLDEPFKWVMVSNKYENQQSEREAKAALEKLGRFVDYEWEWMVDEQRPPNNVPARLAGTDQATPQE